MRGKYHLYLNNDEHDLALESLITWKNKLMKQGRYTDAIDDLIIKLVNAPTVKIKVK